MGIALLESHPNFPFEDISDGTAAVLEMWLQNKELVGSVHEQAELFYLYKLGHAAFEQAAREPFVGAQYDAFSYGVSVFETTSALVRPVHSSTLDREETVLYVGDARRKLDHSFIETLTAAKDNMQQQLPNTTGVIGESALRFYKHYTDYALSGAAIARELEISTVTA